MQWGEVIFFLARIFERMKACDKGIAHVSFPEYYGSNSEA